MRPACLLLALTAACSIPSGSDPSTRPLPFSELTGVALGITTDRLAMLRPNARENEVWDLHDSLTPFSILYRQDLGLLQSIGLRAHRIEMISAWRPLEPTDTTGTGIGVLLKAASPGEIRCRLRDTSDQSLVWHSRQVGDDEFIATVIPEVVRSHRNGVDTVAAHTMIVWRHWIPERENEVIVPCPDSAR